MGNGKKLGFKDQKEWKKGENSHRKPALRIAYSNHQYTKLTPWQGYIRKPYISSTFYK
jgi:hypothetical protein